MGFAARMRGSPTCGAPTSSSRGTWWAAGDGQQQLQAGFAQPGLQAGQGAHGDSGGGGQPREGGAPLLADAAQPRSDFREDVVGAGVGVGPRRSPRGSGARRCSLIPSLQFRQRCLSIRQELRDLLSGGGHHDREVRSGRRRRRRGRTVRRARPGTRTAECARDRHGRAAQRARRAHAGLSVAGRHVAGGVPRRGTRGDRALRRRSSSGTGRWTWPRTRTGSST